MFESCLSQSTVSLSYYCSDWLHSGKTLTSSSCCTLVPCYLGASVLISRSRRYSAHICIPHEWKGDNTPWGESLTSAKLCACHESICGVFITLIYYWTKNFVNWWSMCEKKEFFNEIWVEYFDKTRWKQLLKKNYCQSKCRWEKHKKLGKKLKSQGI